MGADAAIYGPGPGVTKCLGTPSESRSSRRDIVNQEEGSAFGSHSCRKAPLRQFEAAGPGLAGLTDETVAPQKQT
jgi:hypothetical protein